MPKGYNMHGHDGVWAIILAAGDGSRLSHLTTDERGVVVPKQYCSFAGGPSLLARALARADAVAERERIAVVVASDHRRWWMPELAELPRSNVLVQPCNRGTACGLLLPLLHVRLRDPEAIVAVFPSDHFIAEEGTFRRALAEAVRRAGELEGRLLLLGINPDHPDPEYGWIRPASAVGGIPSRVVSFVEKPDRPLAERLMATGALWNSFTFVTSARTLWELFQRRLPWLVERFAAAFAIGQGAWWEARLSDVYDTLPTLDFSRAVLERTDEELRVVAVPPCGWTDLGTPERLAKCLQRVRSCDLDGLGVPPNPAPLDLADAAVHAEAGGHPLGDRLRGCVLRSLARSTTSS